jgi:hypothetical protein
VLRLYSRVERYQPGGLGGEREKERERERERKEGGGGGILQNEGIREVEKPLFFNQQGGLGGAGTSEKEKMQKKNPALGRENAKKKIRLAARQTHTHCEVLLAAQTHIYTHAKPPILSHNHPIYAHHRLYTQPMHIPLTRS